MTRTLMVGPDPAAALARVTARPVILCESLPDGTVMADQTAIIIGIRPLSPIEDAGRQARQQVRRGMAEILAWLGEPVATEPTSEQILAYLRGGESS